MGKRHMALYFSHRFKHRAVFETRAPYASAARRDRECLRRTQQTLLGWLGCIAYQKAGISKWNPYTGVQEWYLETLRPDELEDRWRETALAPDFDPPRAAAEAEERIRQSDFEPFKDPGTADRQVFGVAKRIDPAKLMPDIERFFERYLHDSMAGFIGPGMDEYRRNGLGFMKFRTVFKGND